MLYSCSFTKLMLFTNQSIELTTERTTVIAPLPLYKQFRYFDLLVLNEEITMCSIVCKITSGWGANINFKREEYCASTIFSAFETNSKNHNGEKIVYNESWFTANRRFCTPRYIFLLQRWRHNWQNKRRKEVRSVTRNRPTTVQPFYYYAGKLKSLSAHIFVAERAQRAAADPRQVYLCLCVYLCSDAVAPDVRMEPGVLTFVNPCRCLRAGLTLLSAPAPYRHRLELDARQTLDKTNITFGLSNIPSFNHSLCTALCRSIYLEK